MLSPALLAAAAASHPLQARPPSPPAPTPLGTALGPRPSAPPRRKAARGGCSARRERAPPA
eukprot:3755800-Rhodomonas_salina.1